MAVKEFGFIDASSATGTSTSTGVYRMFYGDTNLEFVPYIFKNGRRTPEPGYNQIFGGCPNLDFARMRADGWEEKYLATAPGYVAP